MPVFSFVSVCWSSRLLIAPRSAGMQADVAASDANVLENALEVVVHEGAFKEHLAMLEAARKSASHETAALKAEVEELREKLKAYDENNAILRHHVTAKRQEVASLQQQLVEQTQVRQLFVAQLGYHVHFSPTPLFLTHSVQHTTHQTLQEHLDTERAAAQHLREQCAALEHAVQHLTTALSETKEEGKRADELQRLSHELHIASELSSIVERALAGESSKAPAGSDAANESARNTQKRAGTKALGVGKDELQGAEVGAGGPGDILGRIQARAMSLQKERARFLGLGLEVSQQAEGKTEVTGLVAGGLAELSGQVRVGDLLVAVDGVWLHGQPVSAVRALLSGGSESRLPGHIHPVGSQPYLPTFLTLERPPARAEASEPPRGDDEKEIIEVSLLGVISPTMPPPPGLPQGHSNYGSAPRPSTIGHGERGRVMGSVGKWCTTAMSVSQGRADDTSRYEEEIEALLESETRTAAVSCMASWAVVSARFSAVFACVRM